MHLKIEITKKDKEKMKILLKEFVNGDYEEFLAVEALEISHELPYGEDTILDLPDVFDKFTNLKELYVSTQKNTLTLPPSIFKCEKLEKLSLVLDIKVTADDFKQMRNLKALKSLTLHFYNNEEAIPNEIAQIENLETLELYGAYDLKESLQSVFKSKTIKNLELQDDEDVRLSSDYFNGIENMTGLQELSIMSRHLTKLPEPIYKLQNLKKLMLDCEKMEEASEDISKLENLESLRILTNIFDENACKLRKLKELYLQANQNLAPIPKEIGNLTNLEWLSIGSETIPSEIEKLKKLKSVWLSYHTKSLPDSFANLEGLNKLHLKSSSLDENSFKIIGKLKNLEVLNAGGISNGRLKEFPLFIRNLKSLKILNVRGLKYEEIPSWLVELEQLEALNLSHTNIKEIPDFFIEFKKLRELNIHYTQKLKSISPCLSKMKSLKILHKELIKTKKLAQAIESITSLEELNISHFNYKEYPNLEKMTNLKILDISNSFAKEELTKEIAALKLPDSLEVLVVDKDLVPFLPEKLQQKVNLNPSATYSKTVFNGFWI